MKISNDLGVKKLYMSINGGFCYEAAGAGKDQ